MLTDYEKRMIELREEELRLKRIQMTVALAQAQLAIREARRKNRSWYDKLEDKLFGW